MTKFRLCQFCSRPCQVLSQEDPFIHSEWYICKNHPFSVTHLQSYDDNDIHVLSYWFIVKHRDNDWTFNFINSKLTKELSVWTFINIDPNYIYKGRFLPINPENALAKLQTMITFS